MERALTLQKSNKHFSLTYLALSPTQEKTIRRFGGWILILLLVLSPLRAGSISDSLADAKFALVVRPEGSHGYVGTLIWGKKNVQILYESDAGSLPTLLGYRPKDDQVHVRANPSATGKKTGQKRRGDSLPVVGVGPFPEEIGKYRDYWYNFNSQEGSV